MLVSPEPRAAAKFDTKSAPFALSFHGHVSAYTDMTTVVMPSATVAFEAVGGPPGAYDLTVRDGVAVPASARRWRWTAPSTPGLYTLRFSNAAADDSITLHAFVMVPATEVRNGVLNGYRIGQYPAKPLNGNPNYLAPPGFIEVTKDNEDTKVSPHFRLKQFLCKQEPINQFPKYVVLQERLLLKLEAVLQEVNAFGVDADTLNVMSAYRTPFYNHAIGDVLYSMHQWGSAADVFVDTKSRGQMDDLNHDGQIDTGDSRFLYDMIEGLLARPTHKSLQGGMGFYPATRAHPPFVHVDVRGTAARWRG
jgi:hypothetical protein